jgi:hypothetical protein
MYMIVTLLLFYYNMYVSNIILYYNIYIIMSNTVLLLSFFHIIYCS